MYNKRIYAHVGKCHYQEKCTLKVRKFLMSIYTKMQYHEELRLKDKNLRRDNLFQAIKTSGLPPHIVRMSLPDIMLKICSFRGIKTITS